MAGRDFKDRQTIFEKFQEINKVLLQSYIHTFNLESSYKDKDKPNMQVVRFNEYTELIDGEKKVKVDAEDNAVNCDWGIYININPSGTKPNNYMHMPIENYFVEYDGVRYPITYKIHLSINRYDVNSDNISFDMIINHDLHPRCVSERDAVYLKFRYHAGNSLPLIAAKDIVYGIKILTIDDRIDNMLKAVLNAGQSCGVLTNFRPNYEFRADLSDLGVPSGPNLGTLILTLKDRNFFMTPGSRKAHDEKESASRKESSSRRYAPSRKDGAFEEKYLKYKAKYLELKNKLNL